MMQAGARTDWVGSFSPVVFTEVLKKVSQESRSGALQVASGPSVKTIHINKGSVRFARSNVRQDRLCESMLAHKLISTDEYELASEKMRTEGCRFGEALLSMGRLTEKELNRELAIQVQRIVLSLFRLEAGTYRFDEADTGSGHLPFRLSVAPLLLKGLRSVTDGKMILSALPAADTRVRAADAVPYKFDPKKLAPIERAVLERAGDGTPIGDIIRDCEVGRKGAFRSCFALLSVGLLEPVPDDVGPGARGEESHEDLIRSQFERLEFVSDEDLLGIRKGTDEGELKQSYEGLRSEWSEVRTETADPSLLRQIDAINFRLAAAYSQLLAERRRIVVEPHPSAPEPATIPVDLERNNRVERLDRDARLHVQVRDWSGAVSLLHELVALEPKTAEYQAMLARALQHHPRLSKNAEQHFLEAVTLAPEDVEIRLSLARYYQATGKLSRALAEIEAAMVLDEGNEEARRMLDRTKHPTRMQTLLKRIFG